MPELQEGIPDKGKGTVPVLRLQDSQEAKVKRYKESKGRVMKMAEKEEKIPEDMNKQAEQLLMQFQFQNQQLENLVMQRQTMAFQKSELESALKEMETDGEFYKIVGPIMVKKEKESLKTELTDKKEEIELMLKTIEKNEKKIREMLEKNREKLQEILPALQHRHE